MSARYAWLIVLAGAAACQKNTGSSVQKIRLATVRCSYGQSASRPFPKIHYLKFGGVCQGQGSYLGKDATQLVVACRTFSDPDATGAITVESGQVDETTGDCSFATQSGGSETVTRDQIGSYVLDQTSGGASEPLTCNTDRVSKPGNDGECDESLLTVPPDGATEAAWLGVQGVCVTAASCTEYSGLATSAVAGVQQSCVGDQGMWRSGTCALADTTYKAGCLKSPATGGGAGSTEIVWTPNAVACSP